MPGSYTSLQRLSVKRIAAHDLPLICLTHVARNILFVHQRMDHSRISQANGGFAQVTSEQRGQTPVAISRMDSQRLDDQRINRRAPPRLQPIGDGKDETDRLACMLGQQNQFGQNIWLQGTMLFQELFFADRASKEIVAKAGSHNAVDATHFIFKMLCVETANLYSLGREALCQRRKTLISLIEIGLQGRIVVCQRCEAAAG